MRNLCSVKQYYGFSSGDKVILVGSVFCDKLIDAETEFEIISFPIKTSKLKPLILHGEEYSEKEKTRDRFVYGKTIDGSAVRTYISNIKKK